MSAGGPRAPDNVNSVARGEGNTRPYLQGSGLVQRICSTKHFCSAASSCKLSLSSSSAGEGPRDLVSNLRTQHRCPPDMAKCPCQSPASCGLCQQSGCVRAVA